jgi:HSP20 family protein
MARTIARWDPFQQLARMQQDIDAMLGRAGVRTSAAADAGDWMPAMDVEQTGDGLVLRVDLPGIDPADVSVQVANGLLTVSGQRREEKEETHEGYVTRERRYGSFSRSLMLPEGVDEEDITADCRDGVLRISMPKPTTAQPRSIEIQTG